KKRQADDLLTIFSEHLTVKFTHSDGHVEVVTGRWCNECRSDPEFLVKYGRQKVFHIGSNSSCCQHIRSHYTQYHECCAERKIPENHYAVLCQVEKARQGVKNTLERG
ncbi:hypothetical protein SCLCIDRAFT_79034, partial [Scleroderma citrinum Foug A]